MKNKTFKIAVISDIEGFNHFLNDNEVYHEPYFPYTIKFIMVDCPEKTQGAIFNSYIINYSSSRLKDLEMILNCVKSRIIHIGL